MDFYMPGIAGLKRPVFYFCEINVENIALDVAIATTLGR